MTQGVLLDTHALLWLVTAPETLSGPASVAIGESQATRSLFVSAISAWELSVATQKRSERGRPDLAGLSASAWFSVAARRVKAKVVPITQTIALQAAEVALVLHRKDPGDCFLIATARVRGLTFATRDGPINALAQRQPDYLQTVAC